MKPFYLWALVPTLKIPKLVLFQATNETGKLAQYLERAGKGATEIYFVNSESAKTKLAGLPSYSDANAAIARAVKAKVSKGARVRVDERYMSFAEAAKLELVAYAPTTGEGHTPNYWKKTSWMTDETAEALNDAILERAARIQQPKVMPKARGKAKAIRAQKSTRGF
tara:strand:- start:897 stop:1397 length:501 start_codon:yes stop_codon:yes gene_type:complete